MTYDAERERLTALAKRTTDGPPGLNPLEGLLRLAGAGQVIDAAKELANAGAVARIIKFADDAESLAEATRSCRARLDRLEVALVAIAAALDVPEGAIVAAFEAAGIDAGPGPGARPRPDPGQPDELAGEPPSPGRARPN